MFDFDGVIADTFDICFEINKQINPKIKAEDDYTRLFDGNINDWKRDTALSEEEVKKSDDDFFNKYISKLAKANVFPGMKKTLGELAKSHTLIIISSTIASPIKDFLAINGLTDYFEKFDGDMVVHNNKSERIKKVLDKYGVTPRDCVFVTDTRGDMREAAECGIKSIGVGWGFQKAENLAKEMPFMVAKKPEDLLAAVNDLFKGEVFVF